MAETKPFASLSSGLLARKGGAKPAMRPQGFGSFGGSLEDLGWNDMGTSEYHDHVPTPIDALTPSPRSPAAPPRVVEQQQVLRETFSSPEPEPEPQLQAEPEPQHEPQLQAEPQPQAEPVPQAQLQAEPAAPRKPRSKAEIVSLPQRPAVAAKAKAAFTLRLEPDRHLKLRLACALSRRSAQQLVTAALDDFLATLPELEALASHLPVETPQRRRGSR
jgi:hypothetical protein